MKNTIPKDTNGALSLAMSAINGATALGAALKHMTAAALTALRISLLTAFNNVEANRQLLRVNRATLDSVYDSARAFAALARDILKPTLGSAYSETWDRTGFRGSLAIPETAEDMIRLIESLKDFFAANPTLECAGLNVNATVAQSLLDALTAANGAVLNQRTALDGLMSDRDEKFEALRKGLRDLVNELATIMDPMDARWLSFGFNKPDADETPDVPTGLSAILIGPNAAATKWEASARAEYYRVWMKLHGAEGDYSAVGSPADLDFTLENLPLNSSVDIAVSAVNNGGESALSEKITITTH